MTNEFICLECGGIVDNATWECLECGCNYDYGDGDDGELETNDNEGR